MPINPQRRVERQSARALARVWADSAYWRENYTRKIPSIGNESALAYWRSGALEMFVHLTDADAKEVRELLNASPKVPWLLAQREDWVRRVTVHLVMLIHRSRAA